MAGTLKTRTRSVVYLEDDADYARFVELLFEDIPDLDVTFEHHRRSERTLAALAEREVDLLFLDYDLGKGRKTGLDVLAQSRASGYSGPIVMCSNASPQIAAQFVPSGADVFLRKSELTPTTLRDAVRLAEARRSRRLAAAS